MCGAGRTAARGPTGRAPEAFVNPAEFSAEMSRIGQDVSRETLAALETYADLLAKWQACINLVA